jgi:hypothetical protein
MLPTAEVGEEFPFDFFSVVQELLSMNGSKMAECSVSDAGRENQQLFPHTGQLQTLGTQTTGTVIGLQRSCDHTCIMIGQ